MSLSFAYILSQILVVIAYLLLIRTYALKNKRKIVILNLVSMIANALSYVLLSAWTGLAMSIVAIFRSVYILQKDRYPKTRATSAKHDFIFLAVFLLGVVLATLPAYAGPLSLLPVCSTVIYTYSLWQKSTKVYKFCGIPVDSIGLIYFIYIGSIFGAIMEAAVLVASIIGFINELKKSPSPISDSSATNPIQD